MEALVPTGPSGVLVDAIGSGAALATGTMGLFYATATSVTGAGIATTTAPAGMRLT